VDAPSPATIVWIAPARSAGDRHALEQWALARGVRLVLPADGSLPEIPVDLAIGSRVEDELDRARDAIAAHETDAAERALARAEALLREHPELPQGAWLMAEVHRVWSARWQRLQPRDVARADAAWQRAAALDGGRVAGVGETAAPALPSARGRIELEGAGPGAVLRIDGIETAQGHVTRAAGEHQMTVTESSSVRYAAWVTFAEGAVVRVHVPGPPACSTADLERARVDGAQIHAAGVHCSSWVAALPSGAGALRIATCEKERCGPLVEWRVGTARLPSGPSTEEPRPGRWPAWATWTAFGAGIAVATTVALAATGAFDKQRSEARFVNGGVKIQGM